MTDPHAHENRGRVRVISTEVPEGTVPPSMSLHPPTPSRGLRGEDVPQDVLDAAAPPDTVALRDRLVEALDQHALATGVPTPFPPNVPEDPWLAAARRADEARVDALLPAVETWAAENLTAAVSSAPATDPESAPAREVPAAPHEWCGASTRINVGSMPSMPYIGPCVLRHRHDGPVHLDNNGATWTDPQPATAATSSALCPPALRDQLADVLRKAFEHHIVAEWICCDLPQKGHKLCKQGRTALLMVKELLDEDSTAHTKTSPIVDAALTAVAPEIQRRERERVAAEQVGWTDETMDHNLLILRMPCGHARLAFTHWPPQIPHRRFCLACDREVGEGVEIARGAS